MGQVVLLSLTASLNPTLLACTTVMLMLPRPGMLMMGYLAGALMTSITLGLVIVFSLSGSGTAKTTKHTLSPGADLALGGLCLVVTWVLWSGRYDRFADHRRKRKAAKPEKGPPRWQRALSQGSPRMTFVVGAVLTLPGASYLAGLARIHQLKYGTAVTVLVVIGFNVVMMWLLELPLAGFLLSPEQTPRRIERAKLWVHRHAYTFALRGSGAIGSLLIIKGAVGLIVG